MSTRKRWMGVACVALVAGYACVQGFGTSFLYALVGVFVRDRSPWADTMVGVVFHAAIIQLTLAALVAMRLGPRRRGFRRVCAIVAALPPLLVAAGLFTRLEADAGLTALLMALLVVRFGVQRPEGAARPLFIAWAACAVIPLSSALQGAPTALEVVVPVAASLAAVLWLARQVLRVEGDAPPAAGVAPAA